MCVCVCVCVCVFVPPGEADGHEQGAGGVEGKAGESRKAGLCSTDYCSIQTCTSPSLCACMCVRVLHFCIPDNVSKDVKCCGPTC